MIRIWGWMVLLAFGLWAGGDQQKDEKAPSLSVKEVLAKVAKADGSEGAREKLKSLRVTYGIEMVGMGMSMTVKMISGQNKALLVSELNGAEVSRQGFDGKEAWSKDMMMGLRSLEGQERLSLEQMTLKGTVEQFSIYDEVVFGDEKTFDGKEAIELIGKKKGVPDTHLYVDAKTFLTLGTRMIQKSPQGEIPALMTVKSYRTLEAGLKFPDVVSIQAGPMKMNMVAKEIEENTDLKGVEFSKPKS